MNIAIIQFPGSNCESESIRAVKNAGMDAEEFLWNRPLGELRNFDGYFIVGGFSYEDRSRAGIIASLDPLMDAMRHEAAKGKPVLGICNGAQILVETGLVPGLKDDAIGMALATNKRVKDGKVLGVGFYNAWVHIQSSVPAESSAFTRHLKPGAPIRVPVAHGEGRFIIPEELLSEMKRNNLTLFQYCDETGAISSDFPVNPNGAVYNLAAVGNSAGNVMAMMPHPERTVAGNPIFTSMREYIREEKKIHIAPPLSYEPKQEPLHTYMPPDHSFQLPISLNITDKEADTVTQTLKRLGISATISRATHWDIVSASSEFADFEKSIIDSGELFNPRKERIMAIPETNDRTVMLLVRYRDDFVGQKKKEDLTSRFGLSGIERITNGVLWTISVEDPLMLEETVNQILGTHILHNSYSQECVVYALESRK